MDGYDVECVRNASGDCPRRRRTTARASRHIGRRSHELRLVWLAQQGGAGLRVISRRADALSIRAV